MFKWTDFGINLTDEDLQQEKPHLEITCHKCNHKRKKHKPTLLINLENNSWFCKHCGFAGDLFQGVQPVPVTGTHLTPWKLNPFLESYQPSLNLSKAAIETFKKKHISEQTLQHFKIGQSKNYFPF